MNLNATEQAAADRLVAAVGPLLVLDVTDTPAGTRLACGHTAPVRASWEPRREYLYADDLEPCGTCHTLVTPAA